MSKKHKNGGRSMLADPTTARGTPPLLSDKLIARLQGAVSAARDKRLHPSRPMTDSSPGEAARRAFNDE